MRLAFQSTVIGIAGIFVLTSVTGCKKKEEDAQTAGYQQGNGGYQQPPPGGGYQQPPPGGGYQQPPPGGGYQQPPPGGTAPPAGTGTPPPGGTAGGTAQALDPAAGAAATAILNGLAQQQAPAGAKALGAPVVGNFQAGQTLSSQVQLSPGKCYTVVAAGVPPVSEVNVQFVSVTPLPNVAPVLAQDNDNGATGVLGKKPNCYRWAFPFAAPVKVVLTVAGGNGIAAAQVYEK